HAAGIAPSTRACPAATTSQSLDKRSTSTLRITILPTRGAQWCSSRRSAMYSQRQRSGPASSGAEYRRDFGTAPPSPSSPVQASLISPARLFVYCPSRCSTRECGLDFLTKALLGHLL